MAKPVSAMGLALAGWVRDRLPDSAVPALAGLAGDIATACQPRRRRIAADNVRWLTGADDAGYARRLFRNFVYCNSDLLRLPRLGVAGVIRLVGGGPLQALSDLHARTRGTVLVGGHVGNFELAAAVVAAAGLPAAALVETIDPVRDANFARLRTSTRLRLFSADRRGAREAQRWLRNGGVLIVAGDRALNGAGRLTVPFGCGWRQVPTGPAWLALTSGATITTGYLVRAPHGDTQRYEGRLDEPIDTVALGEGPDAVAELTRRVARRLSATAVTFADQWFVFDPAWHRAPPEQS